MGNTQYQDLIDRLDSRRRSEYNSLHALRLLEVHGSVRPARHSGLEQQVAMEADRGYASRSGGWIRPTTYELSSAGRSLLGEQREEVARITAVAGLGGGDFYESVVRENGHDPAEFRLRKAILDGEFDRTPYGVFSRRTAPQPPRVRTQARTASGRTHESGSSGGDAVPMYIDSGQAHAHNSFTGGGGLFGGGGSSVGYGGCDNSSTGSTGLGGCNDGGGSNCGSSCGGCGG